MGRHARRLARARTRVPRGGLDEGPTARGARRAAADPGRRSSCAAPAASPKGCRRRSRDTTLPKFRAGGLLIVHAGGQAGLFSAIIGGWASGAIGSEPVTREIGAEGDRDVNRSLLDPTSRARAEHPRARAARPASLDGTRRRAARHLQAARRRVPRPDRRAAAKRAACDVERFAKPTFTKPAPVDLRHEIIDEVRRRDRGPRRLRLVHVVQCARHREPRSGRHPDGLRRVHRVRRRRRRAVARARRRSGARLRRRTRSRTAPTTSSARSPTTPSLLSSRRCSPLRDRSSPRQPEIATWIGCCARAANLAASEVVMVGPPT